MPQIFIYMPASWLKHNSPCSNREIHAVCVHSQLFPALRVHSPPGAMAVPQPEPGRPGGCLWVLAQHPPARMAGEKLALAVPQDGSRLSSTPSTFLFPWSDLRGVLKCARSAAENLFLGRDEVTYEKNAENNPKIFRKNNMDINMPK